MKTIKRIVSVVLLIVIILVVGYFVYTGNQLHNNQENISNQIEVAYEEG